MLGMPLGLWGWVCSGLRDSDYRASRLGSTVVNASSSVSKRTADVRGARAGLASSGGRGGCCVEREGETIGCEVGFRCACGLLDCGCGFGYGYGYGWMRGHYEIGWLIVNVIGRGNCLLRIGPGGFVMLVVCRPLCVLDLTRK
jgi:hypothetical protein